MRRFLNTDSCRFCLTTESDKIYYPLREIQDLDILTLTFDLETDLTDRAVSPSHVCDSCDLVIKRFVKLKKTAKENDVFVRQYQEQINKLGVRDAFDQFINHSGKNDSNNHENDSQKEGNDIGSEMEKQVKEELNSDHEEGENKAGDENEFIESLEEVYTEENLPQRGETETPFAMVNDLVKCENDISQSGSNPPMRQTYNCNYCDKVLKTPLLLRSHLITHNSKVVKCPKCVPDRFMKQFMINKHMKNSHSSKPRPKKAAQKISGENEKENPTFDCNQCDVIVRTKQLLAGHKLRHHADDLVLCPECLPDRFIKQKFLRKHMKVMHELQREILCEYPGCEKKFKQRMVMKTHLRFVHQKDFILCPDCGADNIRNMHYHRQNCTNTISNICDICAKKFTSKPALETHVERVHGAGAIATICSICCKEVKEIKSHMKFVHTEEDMGKYPCDQCDNSFRTKQNLKRHVKRVHNGEKDQCPLCSDWFKSLHCHLYQVHKKGKQHTCEQCGSVFFRGDDLRRHIERIHNKEEN